MALEQSASGVSPRLRACVLTLALALSGCADVSMNPMDWVGGKPAGPKPAELPPISNPHAVKLLWSAGVGSGDRYSFRPVLVADGVYAASRNGAVVRLNAATGQVQWRVELGRPISAGVGAGAAVVVVASEEGVVFALDSGTGKLRWSARVSSEVLAPPEVGEDLVLVRSADSRIFAFNIEDGKRRWIYQRAASTLLVRTPAGAVIAEGHVYAGFAGGKLLAIALANGAVRWEATVAVPRGTTELERVTDVVGQPVVQGREVCAVAYQGRVACFDLRNGAPVWARESSSLTGVSLDARYAFVSDERGSLHALDRTTGRSLWKQDRLANRQLSLPLPLGAEVVVGDLQGYVHFVQRETGTFVARLPTDGSPIRAAPLKIPAGFVVQTQNGGGFALSP